MAAHLGAETVLVDVTGGTAGAAAGIAAAVTELGCDLLVCVDVGGDVLAHGDEPGLASPLCDAVMVAAALNVAGRVKPLLAVIGPGCDGELTAGEVLARVAELARAGAWLGTWGLAPETAAELDAAAGQVPTEASLQVVRCARGEVGQALIRGGRRSVELGPVGALTFVFDPLAAPPEALPLARAVADAGSIEQGRAALAARGVKTELDYERSRAGEGSSWTPGSGNRRTGRETPLVSPEPGARRRRSRRSSRRDPRRLGCFSPAATTRRARLTLRKYRVPRAGRPRRVD